jgi:hypothetical protein
MKKLMVFILFLNSILAAQGFELGEARGIFVSVGVGPKLPIGEFSATNDLGIGFDFTATYTDNQFLPLFFNLKFGFQTFPGATKMYKTTNYASFTTNEFLVMPGMKFYFPPIISDEILIMPIAEVGPSLGIFNNTHVFKSTSSQTNFDESLVKFGFHVGGGFSMFFLEGMLNYYFFPDNHALSFDLRVQIPVFAKI